MPLRMPRGYTRWRGTAVSNENRSGSLLRREAPLSNGTGRRQCRKIHLACTNILYQKHSIRKTSQPLNSAKILLLRPLRPLSSLTNFPNRSTLVASNSYNPPSPSSSKSLSGDLIFPLSSRSASSIRCFCVSARRIGAGSLNAVEGEASAPEEGRRWRFARLRRWRW